MIPVGGGGEGVRVLRKITRNIIEGFMGGFQIFHCGIFGGKKIWKVPLLVGGGGGVGGCDFIKFLGAGRIQNNLKIGVAPLAYTT